VEDVVMTTQHSYLETGEGVGGPVTVYRLTWVEKEKLRELQERRKSAQARGLASVPAPEEEVADSVRRHG